MAGPVETKVKAGAAGAGLGAAVGGFACWLLDAHVLTPGVEGDLPGAVTVLVMAGAAAGVAWVSGYIAKHTTRSDEANLARTLSDAGVDPSLAVQVIEAARRGA